MTDTPEDPGDRAEEILERIADLQGTARFILILVAACLGFIVGGALP